MSPSLGSPSRGPTTQRRRKPTRLRPAGLLLVFVLAVALQARDRPTTMPPSAMVGRWQGQGRIDSKWTSDQSLSVNLVILPDGSMAGTIGLATFAGGRFEHYSNQRKRPYVLTVNLTGPLLQDGVMRRSFRFNLRLVGERLVGSGESDGSRLHIDSGRDIMRRSGRLQVSDVSLSRVDGDVR